MISIAFIVALAFLIAFVVPILHRRKPAVEHNARYDLQMKKLWNAAQTSMRDHKPLRAEKALLTILKFDEKNAAAYNRLGILYAKEQKFNEAIECFEIAQSLDNNPSSLHNVGLIYLETGAFEKAVMAFEQAIALENTVPSRYIALAKAQEKLGQTKAAVDSLERAYELDHSASTLRLILAIHELTGDVAALADITARIEQQLASEQKPTRRSLQNSHQSTRTKSTTARSTVTKSVPRPQTSSRSAARLSLGPSTSAATSSTSAPRPTPSPRSKKRI